MDKIFRFYRPSRRFVNRLRTDVPSPGVGALTEPSSSRPRRRLDSTAIASGDYSQRSGRSCQRAKGLGVPGAGARAGVAAGGGMLAGGGVLAGGLTADGAGSAGPRPGRETSVPGRNVWR